MAIDGLLAYGASPRASIGLINAGRALALLRGRDHLLPQDVYDIAYDVLNHRLVLSFDAVADGVTVDDVLVEVLTTVVSPRVSSSQLTGPLALLRGRDHLLPQDVYDIAYDVLNHGLVLSFDAVADGITVDDVLVEVLTTVVSPRVSSSQLAGNRAPLAV